MPKSVFTGRYAILLEQLIAARKARGLSQSATAAELSRPQSFVSKYERGERRLDVVELLEVAAVLDVDMEAMLRLLRGGRRVSGKRRKTQTILDLWEITAAELTGIVDANPSLRGMMLGYVAEAKLTRLLERNPQVSKTMKYDDHDRSRKGDRVILYRGHEFIIESKSLQSNTVRRETGRWEGKAQVDASDKRPVTLSDGSTLDTTCLLVGEFDILAVNLFAFEGIWRFVFAKNGELPTSKYRGYTPQQREQLLGTLVSVSWPPKPPFHADVFDVLEELVRER